MIRGDPRLDDELVSKEEMTVALYLLAAVAVAVVAVLVSISLLMWALPGEGAHVDGGRMAIALGACFVTATAILYAVFGRLRGSVASAAAVDLAAAPDLVWDAVVLRDDYPGWKKIYAGIDRLNEAGEVYRVHYAEDSDCPRCKLPRDPDRPRWTSRIEVLEARRPSLYRIRTAPRVTGAPADDPGRLLDTEDTVMRLEPLPGGGTRVMYESAVLRPKVWMAVLTMMGRPVREHLRSLAAHLEGRPDETLFGIAARRMDAARAAPQRCSCPAEAAG
jgi:hypothetical protein